MGLISAIRKRFANQFVAVILDEHKCRMKQKVIKNGETIFVETTTFEMEEKEELSQRVIAFLNEVQQKYEQTHIALLINTLGQGVLPGCGKELFKKYNIDENHVKSICYDERFTVYASKIDINWIVKSFEKIGLDFIFSPFLILDHFIQREGPEEEITLYILNLHNGFAMMIMKHKRLLYGAFFNTEKEENLLYTDYTHLEESGVEQIEEEMFEEFEVEEEEIEDLEPLEEEEIEEVEATEESGEEEFFLFEKDARFVKYLDTALKEFYESPIYESDFIERVRIFDDDKLNESVIKHIESELLLETRIKSVNTLDAVIDLAVEEVLGAV